MEQYGKDGASLSTIIAAPNKILADWIDMGMKKQGGVIIPDDQMKERGIRNRICRIHAVGEGVNKDIKPGDFILVSHGRWTRGVDMEINGKITTLRGIEYSEIIGVYDEQPEIYEFSFGTNINAI